MEGNTVRKIQGMKAMTRNQKTVPFHQWGNVSHSFKQLLMFVPFYVNECFSITFMHALQYDMTVLTHSDNATGSFEHLIWFDDTCCAMNEMLITVFAVLRDDGAFGFFFSLCFCLV